MRHRKWVQITCSWIDHVYACAMYYYALPRCTVTTLQLRGEYIINLTACVVVCCAGSVAREAGGRYGKAGERAFPIDTLSVYP